MKYHGGKAKLAPKFAPFLIEALAKHDGRFFEPFVGGFNIVPVIHDHVRQALCCDAHPGLITMWKAVQDGSFDPPGTVTREEYNALNLARDWTNPLTAFAAFGCSFSAKEFGGYASGDTRYAVPRSYATEARNGILRKAKAMDRVVFMNENYEDMSDENAVVYCDPPYANTTKYKTNAFDHSAFVKWCEWLVYRGCTVFVSEFEAPSADWNCVWEFERNVSMAIGAGHKRTERLFKLEG